MVSQFNQDNVMEFLMGDGDQADNQILAIPATGHEQEMLLVMFSDLEGALKSASIYLSPYDTHMAVFHLDLLKREYLKMAKNESPGTDIIMMAGTWLQARVPNIVPALTRLWLSKTTERLTATTTYSFKFWINARLSTYEVGSDPINLKLLREAMTTSINDELLAEMCENLDMKPDDLIGSTAVEKAEDLLGLAVRHGRVLQLQQFIHGHSKLMA